MNIGITYNLKDDVSPGAILDNEFCEEFDTGGTIDALIHVFEKNGHNSVKLGSGIKIVDKIRSEKVDFVFNIAEGYSGRNRESGIPSILEMINVPYSGSDPLTLGMTLDKIVAKKIASQAGIPTPRYKVVKSIDELPSVENKLWYPLIVKPAWEGSSKGIYNSSRVSTNAELKESVGLLLGRYRNQPVLIEEYIEGREITVGVIGNARPQIIGTMEIMNKADFSEDFFYSLEVKRDWKNLVSYVSPPRLNPILERAIRHCAISAFKEFGCRDVARIDFRVSKHGRIFMLEVNPLPGLSPEYADLVIMAKKNGIQYNELVSAILNHALSRYEKSGSVAKTI
ncbi:MAG: ATP-grasp domain-containing protein [Candidatus Omnitrophica bacterium]|nr:ATP-grasp domain-containing protein [Candidatus Omnitrophota bacterium]